MLELMQATTSRSEELKQRVVGNAMYGWAESVALSAGSAPDFTRESMPEPSGNLFAEIREVTHPGIATTNRCSEKRRWQVAMTASFVGVGGHNQNYRSQNTKTGFPTKLYLENKIVVGACAERFA